MGRVSLAVVAALAVGCASAGPGIQDAGDLALPAVDAEVTDLAPLDAATGPVLTDLTPATTTIAVGKTFPLAAVFSATWFGQQPLAVALSSSDPTVVVVPATAQLTFNTMQANVSAAAAKVGDATVTATAGGVSKTATVHVVPQVADLGPSPLKVQVGMAGALTVTLSSPALPGGAAIAVASADPNVATVPAMVTIPAGMTTATVTVAAAAIGQVAITASYAGSTKTAQAMAIQPVNRLAVSEVLYDAVGVDDGYEWVELWNGSNAPVDLSGYFLATTSSSMQPTYTAATPALSGVLMPGACVVVGGPMADPKANALPANFAFADAVKFNPNLPNGTLTTAEAVALYQGSPQSIVNAKMVDAVIYGTQQRGIADETGGTTRLDVDYVKFPGQTLERFGPSSWRVQNTPTPGACDWLHL